MRRAVVIVNPAAGGGRAGRMLAPALAELQKQGLSAISAPTDNLTHAVELAQQAANDGSLAIALGGDGLVGAVAGALVGMADGVLGILPGGRGNDLARVLEIPSAIEDACAIIAHGVERAIDLGVVGTDPFVGIASAGFDSDANRIANEAPAFLGSLVYAYGALRALWSWHPATFTLTLDGREHTFRGYSVAAANSKAYGGGMFLAPDASLQDGLLDVVVIAHASKLRFLRNLPRVFSGRHIEEPNVEIFRVQEVAIAADRPFTLYADGDPVAELPTVVSALPAAVKVLVAR